MRPYLFISWLILYSFSLQAQECTDFIERQYDFSQEVDVEYGVAPNYEGTNVSLKMNIFKPVGDENTQRPLVVMIHGGGFYAGHRNDFNELCQWYAERGYVAATISYRLGLHPSFLPVLADDYHEMIRAIYRGMQDTRGAIRFLKGRAEQDSTDVSRVAVMGGSAGGFIALHTAYMDQPEEKPTSANSLNSVGFVPRPDLGPIEGTLNLNGFDTEVQAAINIFGGLRDTSLITSPNDPPLYAYHQSGDPVVHCHRAKPYWQDLPGTNNPILDGSCAIQAKTEQLGFAPENAQFHFNDGSEHDIHDILQIDEEIAEFLNFHFCSTITSTKEQEPEFSIFPNPARDELNISASTGMESLQLYSMSGKIVSRHSVNDHNFVMDTSSLPRGMYILKIVSGHNTSHQKVILE